MTGMINGWAQVGIGVLVAGAVCGMMGAGELVVRVETAGGAPRLVVNGQPVRARIFFGRSGTMPLMVPTAGKDIGLDFLATSGADNATLSISLGRTGGELWLDDIRVADLDSGSDLAPPFDFEAPGSFDRDWDFGPKDAKNGGITAAVEPKAGRDGSAGLHVTVKAPKGMYWPDFRISSRRALVVQQGHRYRVSLWARSQQPFGLTIAMLQGPAGKIVGGPPDCFAQQIKLAAGAGVHIVSFGIPLPWPAPDKAADWSAVDRMCQQVLEANPQALLLPRIGVYPPPWWCKAHDDDVMKYENGQRSTAVVASPVYRREAAERLTALVRHLEEKFGDHVAGYHPTGQNTGEWFYMGTHEDPLNGYAPADQAAWRLWLRQHYASDAALQARWGDKAVTLEAAETPSPQARHAAPNGALREPAAEQALIDWAQFQQEAMADCICQLAHAVRQASGGRKLVLFFYGYVFELGRLGNGPAVSGHYALRRVLDCPDIDVLCGPISYGDRGLGGGAPAMTAAESVALAGKMWLNEDDTHTHMASGSFPGVRDHVFTLEESNQELARNVAQESLRNFATWWMDLGGNGWFNDPGLWEQMKRLAAVDEPMLKSPTPFRPEIAAVVDERSTLLVAAGGSLVTRPGVTDPRWALGRVGAPYGQYLLDDVTAGRVPAKLYVFLNAWRLSAEQRQKLLKATRGAVCIWCYAPGYFDEDRVSPEAMRELTGFGLKLVEPKQAWATPTDAGKRLGIEQAFGVRKPVKPLLAADATADETLATYPDGSAAVTMRRTADGTSIFVGPPGLTPQILRLAAGQAGVHLFTDAECNVYANGKIVAVHASQDGDLTLDVGRAGPVRDLLTGQSVGDGPKIKLSLKRGETRVLGL